MKKAIFHLKRDIHRGDTTLGLLLDPEQKHFCYTLEDTARPFGVKDQDRTAIPETKEDDTYFLSVRTSKKYGKVVVVFTEQSGDLYTLAYGGVSFTQILLHGGNDPEDTSGCILANKNRDVEKMEAYGSMKNQILNVVERYLGEGFDTRLKVTNLPQKS